MKSSVFLFVFSALMSGFSIEVLAQNKSLCTSTDQRELSYDPRVARARKAIDKAGCTVTMIGKSCAISAGHCTSTFEVIEFNVPDKTNKNDVPFSAPEDTYSVEEGSVVYKDVTRGQDWAVLRLNKNEITDKWPGDAQGFYEISKARLQKEEELRISGHGYASDPLLSFSQLTHRGSLVEVEQSGALHHRVDTTGGSSGSSIIRVKDNKIVGVHTHGGCMEASPDKVSGGNDDLADFLRNESWFFRIHTTNSGTALRTNKEFLEAVEKCLAFERKNL